MYSFLVCLRVIGLIPDLVLIKYFICLKGVFCQNCNSFSLRFAEEERAAKQSELNLLTDEVERAQARLLSLEREKVQKHIVLNVEGCV